MRKEVVASTKEEVLKFLSFLIDLYPAYKVEDPSGQIIRLSDGTALVLGRGDAVRPAYVYGPNLPKNDVYIINPLSEGCNDQSQSQIFFYTAMQGSLAIRLLEVILHVIHEGEQAVAAAKAIGAKTTKKKAEKEAEADLAIPREISVILSQKTLQGKAIIDELDEKTHSEADKWLKSVISIKSAMPLISIRWAQKSLTAFPYCPLVQEPDTIDMQTGIRKKTLYVIEAIIRHVFGCVTHDDMKKFAINATEIDDVPPKLYSYLSVEFHLLAKLNPILIAMDSGHAVDLGEFKYHIKRIPEYALNAQWMTQPSIVASTPRAPSLGGSLPDSTLPSDHIPGSTSYNQQPRQNTSTLPAQAGEPSPSILPSAPQQFGTNTNTGSTLPSQPGPNGNPMPMMNNGMMGGNIIGGNGMMQQNGGMIIGQQQQNGMMMNNGMMGGGGMVIGQQQNPGFGFGSSVPGMPFGLVP